MSAEPPRVEPEPPRAEPEPPRAEPEILRAEGDAWRAAAALIADPPGPEAAGVVGSEALARRLGLALLDAGLHPSPEDETWMARIDGEAVGVMVLVGRSPVRGFAQLPRFLGAVIRSVPFWRLPGLARRAWLRARLDFPIPPGSLHVMELHVTPAFQGRGVGGALLRRADAIARERGAASLSLTTHMANPARRLYERNGYAVVGERTVDGYEALTGAPGRVLMEKKLAPPAP